MSPWKVLLSIFLFTRWPVCLDRLEWSVLLNDYKVKGLQLSSIIPK